MNLATVALAWALAAAVPIPATPVVRPAPPPPPFAGVYQPHGVDEIGLWREDDEQERALVNSPVLIHDEALTAYVKGVLCETVGEDRCKAARVYIVREPSFNASMVPNGTMRVNSGLLLRVRNEAELGSVLGHEYGHFEKRHGLTRFKAGRSSSDLLAWAGVLASMANSYNVQRSFNDLQLSVYGGFFRFNRDQEREADLVGLGYLNASTLRSQAASTVWRNQILEAEASWTSRGYRKPDFNRIAFFASHPPDGERANYLYALAAPDDQKRHDGADRYAAALAPWLPIFLDDQVALNDFGGSDFIITRLAETGWTADLWRARGDLYRRRGAPRDLMNAAEFYGKAVALDPAMADAQRGLGLSMVKTGRTSEGIEALRRYRALKPDGADGAMIDQVIASIGGKQ